MSRARCTTGSDAAGRAGRSGSSIRVSNGVDLKGTQILGSDDLSEVAHSLFPGVVVAWDSDGQDDFIIALTLDGHDQTVYRLDLHDHDPNPRPIAADFREYLRHRVGSPP